MSTEDQARAVSVIAAVDLSSLQYHFGIFTNAGKVTSGGSTLSAQGRVDCIIGQAVKVGEVCPVIIPNGGIALVKLGATLAAGALVATAADGRAVAQGASNGDLAWGILLEGGDANDVVRCQFVHKGQINA